VSGLVVLHSTTFSNLVDDYNAKVDDVVNILENINLAIVPITNPDGYVYSWNTDRNWRKNRFPNGGTCYGVDINRNYPDHWGQGGSSNLPCSDTYMGPSVASERETQNTVNYFKGFQQYAPVYAAIDWHSYSQLVLRPYGWTMNDSPDETVLKAQGDAYAAAIASTSGRNYTSQKSIQLYVTTGTASDWFYGDDATSGNKQNGISYRAAGYTVELRPLNNPPGFQLPPVEIIPTGNENYVAVKGFLQYFLANPLRV